MIASRCQYGENKHFDARLGSSFEGVGTIAYQENIPPILNARFVKN
jgi:hypothetical protein